MIRNVSYVETRNGGYPVAGSRIGLDILLREFDVQGQDRRYEEFKLEPPLTQGMVDRLARAKRD